ncbi:MAG: glutamate 5-kinase [Candidatus Lambdaproteobacteria bacterium RIFOXYD12_FULL_49_8]|uniref:Glutamate 5-kinase n=1 Tax=Candidatus Lambdaproteobacteria bacterium RIFOXYD2_FULL_50_16 TaxID=1817772 RepID=A0A1F6G6Z8_9PROT|nr:MAG: glutamate 5-kinase [Candidatus Lambdaproteobacteria bacterium RIFOXYD2_FULL_50_16]OGG97766.1 MAG: glutamate 5-kinase [Candidatus Lambdaproteobacteria bacterium RIFOXYD12_FULL_49_8]
MERILVKVGTNVLTQKDGKLNKERIAELVAQIAVLRKKAQVILVTSGAVGAGREFRDLSKEKDPVIKKQMLAAIGQVRLFQVYAENCALQGVLPAQALITRYDFRQKEAYQNIQSTLEGLLQYDILPIINENDVVSSAETSFSDNDQLAANTAVMMRCDLLVILSNIQGFFTADPSLNPNAKLISQVETVSPELLAYCQDSLSSGGTGGMLSKLKAAEMAAKHGVKTIVSSGLIERALTQAVAPYFDKNAPKLGTTFLAKPKKSKIKKHWMTSHAEVAGVITVDQGAVKALKANKSLLVVGVLKARGNFAKGDVLMIEDEVGIRVGVGLSDHNQAELDQLIQSKPQGAVVIHKNQLYLL